MTMPIIPVSGIAAAFAVVGATMFVADKGSQVISYGNTFDAAGKRMTYLSPDTVSVGETVKLCFMDLSWLRPAPSRFRYAITAGPEREIHDYETHPIKDPEKMGPYHKCRDFIVPKLPPGPALLVGRAESKASVNDDAWSIRTPDVVVPFAIRNTTVSN